MPSRWMFSVGIGRGIVINGVTKEMTDRRGVGMIVMIRTSLMSKGAVKGHPLIHVSISVPHPVSLHLGWRARTIIHLLRGVVGECVPGVKKSNPIDHVTNYSEPCRRFRYRYEGSFGKPVNLGPIRRVIGEQVAILQIPRPHHVKSKIRRANINICRSR